LQQLMISTTSQKYSRNRRESVVVLITGLQFLPLRCSQIGLDALRQWSAA